MDDTIKYLIHADVTADGVVERSDVVGAVFGQTIASRQGQSFGHLTIETSLDKVATATLAAALETITQIGPCRATVGVDEIEDIRAAKRREVIDRATELLTEGFSESVDTSEEILDAVRERVRVADIAEYHGLPAGPRVADGDSVIIVEGRSDVVTLLRHGVKNAVAVEGTDVPEAVADLSRERTVTTLLDGDRGGELILKELGQVADVDYVAFAPPGQSAEDLDRTAVYEALERKTPYDAVAEMDQPRDAVATDGSQTPEPDDETGPDADLTAETAEPAPGGEGNGVGRTDDVASAEVETSGAESTTDLETATGAEDDAKSGDEEGDGTETTAATEATESGDESDADRAETLRGHVREVVDAGSGAVRLLDADGGVLAAGDVGEAFDLIEDGESVPAAVVIDGVLDQRTLDVAAQRGVEQVVARELGEFTKRPTGVRLRAAEALLAG
ncbi:DNA primase [Halobacteriales archaeon SW_7_71_33]|nr:MAG: DNA primase [Halobacteriales archaeon SW_7_71_33]